MKLSTFAIIITILAGAFGLAFILIPARLGAFYGIELRMGGLWMSRYFGAALLFIAMIYWSYSSVSPAAKSWPKLLMFSIVYDVIQLSLTTVAVVKGVGNSMGWTTVALYAVLALSSAYFLGVCKKAAASKS